MLGSLARSGMAGIRETIRANLLTLLAFFTFALQNTSAPWLVSVVVPNAAVGLALFSYYSGVRRLLGLSVPKHLMTLACLVALVVLLAYTYVDWRINPRIVAMSLLQMGFLIAVAVTVQRNMPMHRSRYSYRFVWAVALISAAVCALRAAIYALDLALPESLMEPNVWNIAFLTLGVLIMPCLTLGTIMIIHDRMLADREQEANTDFLTGLMSRKAWWLQAERYCAQALRTRRPLTLLLLDIDHFKRINDTHGHVAGDAVLRHFGLLATATLRTGDHVGRVGGEEFGVLFPDMRGDAVLDVAARLLDSVRRTPCAHGGSTISYTFSAGVAEWVPGENLQVFFERADRKLYAAKA
ncbi:MAG TPA: GGDEF domain-containing protein, partial [Achromobacter sp.]|nr:GGDEF domain-containing protein [Achromobacter sp.]